MMSAPARFSDMIQDFKITDHCFNYNDFVPRLYNYCQSLGFAVDRIMPSCAFCSDESQGYPTLLINKHFGTFPFSHGRVGGIVATDRHGPYATHGSDLLILQASHVGYDPVNDKFGTYKRLFTHDEHCTSNCGKIASALQWYKKEYEFARSHIYLERFKGNPVVTIDIQLLNEMDMDGLYQDGLYVNLEYVVRRDSQGDVAPVKSSVTGKSYPASEELLTALGEATWPVDGAREIGDDLLPEMFHFRKQIYPSTQSKQEGRHRLEENLIEPMPWILTAEAPMLLAAQINTQVEFERVFHTIAREPAYEKKNVLLVTGLNIDISPRTRSEPPITKFIPWAAYFKAHDGTHFALGQQALYEALAQQSNENPNQMNLEQALDADYGSDPVNIKT